MAEAEKVEEVTESPEEESVVESAESDEAEVVEVEEKPPEDALAEVLAARAELEVVESKLLSQKQAIEAEADELHHRLATGQVTALFGVFDRIVDELVGDGGVIPELFGEVWSILDSVEHHDPNVVKSLTSNVYADAVGDHEFFQWWLGMLTAYLVPRQSLYKVMRQMFDKPSGSPFAD